MDDDRARPETNTSTRPSWRRRAAERPTEILDAALDAFIEKGFDAARMEDVAARAGLSKGAVYLYFKSKEALLRALIEREIAPVIRRATGMAAENVPDPAGVIRLVLTLVATTMANPRTFAVPRIVIGLGHRFPDIVSEYRDGLVAPARASLEALIRQGIALGQFRAVDPRAAARAIIGPLIFEALWTHVLGGTSALDDIEAFVSAQMDVLLKGVEEGRAT